MACAAVGFISRGMASHAFLIMQQLEQMPLRMIASACLALRATDVLRRFPTFSAVGAVKAKASRALSEAAMRAGAARVCADLLKPAGSPGRHDAIMNFVSASMPLMRGGELPAAQAACWRQIAAGSHGGVLAAIAILNLGKPPLMALTNAIDPTDDDLALLLQQLRLAKFESSRLSIVIDDLEGIREARALGRQVAAAQTGLSMP